MGWGGQIFIYFLVYLCYLLKLFLETPVLLGSKIGRAVGLARRLKKKIEKKIEISQKTFYIIFTMFSMNSNNDKIKKKTIEVHKEKLAKLKG